MNSQKLQKIIKEKTISTDEVFKEFTLEQEKNVEAEIRYYDVLVELKKLRQQLGLTQEQLAHKAGLPRTTITKVESGGYNPTINTLMSIASAINKRLQVKFL